MNLIQTNRSNMIESVLSYLALHADSIAGSTGLAASIQKLNELIEAVWLKDNEKNGATEGKTAKKKNSGNALEVQVLKIASGLFLLGKKNSNFQIMQLTDFTKSNFKALRDPQKINKAKAVYNSAKGLDLSFANLKQADVEMLNQLADEHKKDIGDASNGAKKRVAAGQTLDQMIDEAIKLLNEEFDRYLKIYEQEKPEMYAGYKAARVIWDKGGGRQNGNGGEKTEVKKMAV